MLIFIKYLKYENLSQDPSKLKLAQFDGEKIGTNIRFPTTSSSDGNCERNDRVRPNTQPADCQASSSGLPSIQVCWLASLTADALYVYLHFYIRVCLILLLMVNLYVKIL